MSELVLIDILARRYGISKISDIFDDESLWETVKNPYRRALLTALLEEVKTEEYYIAKILNEHLPQYIRNYLDVSTCSILNMLKGKGGPIETIFREQPKKVETDNVMRVNIVPGKKVQRLR